MGMPFGEAIHHFSLLTIGDGLAAQIPALLISVATGIIVTRAASDKDLGADISNQILKQRKAPLVAGGAILAFALVPGLPKIPFIVIGGLFFAVGWMLRKSDADADEAAEREGARRRRGQRRRAAARRRPGGAADRPAGAGDRLRPRAARRPARPAARCCRASRSSAARSRPSSAW